MVESRGVNGVISGEVRSTNETGMAGNSPEGGMGGATEGCAMDQSLGGQTVDSRREARERR